VGSVGYTQKNCSAEEVLKEMTEMEMTCTAPAEISPSTPIACPVCGRPARATVLQKLIARITCRRCQAVWQIAPTTG
jgi:hypothetical protein